MKKRGILFLVLGFTILLGGCNSFHWKGRIPDYEEKTYIASSTEITDIILEEQDVPVEICNSDNGN